MVAILHRHIFLEAELGKAGLAGLQGILSQHHALNTGSRLPWVEVELGVVFDGIGRVFEHGELRPFWRERTMEPGLATVSPRLISALSMPRVDRHAHAGAGPLLCLIVVLKTADAGLFSLG